MGDHDKTNPKGKTRHLPLPDLKKRFWKLKLLAAINFPDYCGLTDEQIKKARDIVDEEILFAHHYSTEDAVDFYRMRKGEADRLINIIRQRVSQMLTRINKVALTDNDLKGYDDVTIDVSHYYVFCPDAYAMASETEGSTTGKEYTIRFSMPFLAVLYGGKVKFKSMAHLCAFVDSIVLHEIVHCLGNMNHGKKFKRVLKNLSEIMQIPKIHY